MGENDVVDVSWSETAFGKALQGVLVDDDGVGCLYPFLDDGRVVVDVLADAEVEDELGVGWGVVDEEGEGWGARDFPGLGVVDKHVVGEVDETCFEC